MPEDINTEEPGTPPHGVKIMWIPVSIATRGRPQASQAHYWLADQRTHAWAPKETRTRRELLITFLSHISLKQTIQESQLAPLLLFFREDNQGPLLKNLAVRMIILRTKTAALPYLMHLAAMVAERSPWMGTDYPEWSVTEPPYSPGSPVLLPHMHKPDVTPEKRPLWQSVFQLPEIRVHVSVFLAWVSITDFLTDLPCLCSVLVSLKFTL